MNNKKTCFIIMPFRAPFDNYYNRIIKKGVEDAGLIPIRADEIYGTRAIIDDIFQQITDSHILVAELTGKNPNVAYELGVAHALKKPVVMLAQDIKEVPFDLKHLRIVTYDTTSVDWSEKLRNDLLKTIRSILTRPKSSLAWNGITNEMASSSKLKEFLMRTYREFAATGSSEDIIEVNEKFSTITHLRHQTAKADISHLFIEYFADIDGEIEILELIDLDTKENLEYIINKKEKSGLSFFILFNDVKKKGSSFSLRLKIRIENYLFNLFQSGTCKVRYIPVSKFRFDSIIETYMFPVSDKYSSVNAIFKKHPLKSFVNKKVEATRKQNNIVLEVNYGNLKKGKSEILFEITL